MTYGISRHGRRTKKNIKKRGKAIEVVATKNHAWMYDLYLFGCVQ